MIVKEIKVMDLTIIDEVSDLILSGNPNTIIAQIGKKYLINFFLEKSIISENIKLFVYLEKNKVIAYAIFANKQKYLNKEFGESKILILKKIIFSLKFLQIINLLLIFIHKDLILNNDHKNIKVKEIPNLTYLAVSEKERNKKIGRFFLEEIFNRCFKNSDMTVETDNEVTLNFYLKYMKFKIIGYRRRFPRKLYLLYRKI